MALTSKGYVNQGAALPSWLSASDLHTRTLAAGSVRSQGALELKERTLRSEGDVWCKDFPVSSPGIAGQGSVHGRGRWRHKTTQGYL